MPGKDSKGIRGIIFDLDGTLIDSFEAIREGFNATLPHYGRKPLTLAETKAVVGKSLLQTFGEMLGEAHAEEATRIFRTRYKEVYLEKTAPMPHADALIRELHGEGYRLGVATNKHGGFSRQIIEHLGWGEAIRCVVGDGDTPRVKPDPDMLYRNLESLSLKSGEVLYVGDSPVDMDTGRNAAVRTIGVPTGHHSREMLLAAGAAQVIDDLSGLKGVLSLAG